MKRQCVTNPSQPRASEQARGGTSRLAACKFLLATIAALWLWGTQAMAADGSTTLASSFQPKETMDRLEAAIKAKGMTVFARIDHAAGAAEAGLRCGPPSSRFSAMPSRHAADAGHRGDRHRSAVESAGCMRMQPARSGCPIMIPAGSHTGMGSVRSPSRPSMPWPPRSMPPPPRRPSHPDDARRPAVASSGTPRRAKPSPRKQVRAPRGTNVPPVR